MSDGMEQNTSPSTGEFLKTLRECGHSEFADHLARIRQDKESNGSLALNRNERTYRHNGEDVSLLIEFAVVYGSLWEKEDPAH